jgi:hypothetical protein
MNATNTAAMERADLHTPVRNRYFYGKLLDVHHLELETNYLNAKRWLLNRCVIGSGVVCGLNVEPGQEPNKVTIAPGVAIDRWGREIIVPRRTAQIVIPADVLHEASYAHEGQRDDTGACIHVLICYHECDSDPVPVLAGDCDTMHACEPGSVREQYRVVFRPGGLPPVRPDCRIPDALANGRVDYAALARWISKPCPQLPDDPCIPLANIWLAGEEGHRCSWEDIDISVRRIVFTNRLLFDLVVCLAEGPQYGSEPGYRPERGHE